MLSNTIETSQILPWQEQPWQQLMQAKQQLRLAHGLLFVGANGLGKRGFAEVFANSLLCKTPSSTGEPCKTCHACHMFKSKSHPDMLIIEPEKEGSSIAVDQIRAMVKLVNETASQGGYKVIIINPATAMNTNAANALLKTLEEPTPNTLIILISDQGLRLPTTILSRCQKIIFPKATQDQAMVWLRAQLPDIKFDPQLLLKLSDGAPLTALAWVEKDLLGLRKTIYDSLCALSMGKADPLQVAAKLQDEEQLNVIDLLLSWLTDLLRFQLSENVDDLINVDYQTEITRLSQIMSSANLVTYMDHIQQTRGVLLSSVNLNKQLLMEDILIQWTNYVSR